MDKATAAKYAIEQKQRDEARARKENNITWQTKVRGQFLIDFSLLFVAINYANLFFSVFEQLFKETKDGGWLYIKPLVDRIRNSSDQTNVT